MLEKQHFYTDNKWGMNYKVFLPKTYKDAPLLVYLHGAGERGTKIDHLDRHAIPKLIKEGEDFPAVVLCPQCPAWCVWDNIVDKVKEIIDSVAAEYSVDKSRIYITGSSMGGFGTWSMGLTYSNFFAAIAPVAGGGMAWRAGKLVATPVYAIHGAEDTAVVPAYSKMMVEKVNAEGGNAKLLLLEGKEHNDGIDYAYRNTDVIEWLLAQKRTDFTPVTEICADLF